jgi:hypothetical protein
MQALDRRVFPAAAGSRSDTLMLAPEILESICALGLRNRCAGCAKSAQSLQLVLGSRLCNVQKLTNQILTIVPDGSVILPATNPINDLLLALVDSLIYFTRNLCPSLVPRSEAGQLGDGMSDVDVDVLLSSSRHPSCSSS